jgi:hypothetical protein
MPEHLGTVVGQKTRQLRVAGCIEARWASVDNWVNHLAVTTEKLSAIVH